MQLTNEKNSNIKNQLNIFINFIDFFMWENYFFNSKFLMELDGKPELNKFETLRTQLNENKVRELK